MQPNKAEMLITELTKEELRQIIKDEISCALTLQSPVIVDDLLSRKDTAKYFGITLPTLNAWEKRGYIEATRYGSRVYFSKSQILKTA